MKSTLSLFMFRILTDDSNDAFSLNDFAFLANRLHRRSNLHNNLSFLKLSIFRAHKSLQWERLARLRLSLPFQNGRRIIISQWK